MGLYTTPTSIFLLPGIFTSINIDPPPPKKKVTNSSLIFQDPTLVIHIVLHLPLWYVFYLLSSHTQVCDNKRIVLKLKFSLTYSTPNEEKGK